MPAIVELERHMPMPEGVALYRALAHTKSQISPQAGHALIILGYAIEYLADEFLFELPRCQSCVADWPHRGDPPFHASTKELMVAGAEDLSKLSPDTVRGYATLNNAAHRTNHLDYKTRELIAVAVAISLRCVGCIAVHTAAARKFGATREGIAEALGVTTGIDAGAAIVYSTRPLDAFDTAVEV